MSTGGSSPRRPSIHFNGNLFDNATVPD
jgi:hypothetical protein